MSEELQKALKEMEDRIIATVKEELNPVRREDKRYKNKLHNTKLLLKNYSKFQEHCDTAQFTAKNLIDSELLDMLEDESTDQVYIQSILRTKERTAIMLNHIRSVLDYYTFLAEKNNDEPHIRRCKVLHYMYIDKIKPEQIAEKLNINDRTVWKDINKAVEEISPLLFGIDGLKLS